MSKKTDKGLIVGLDIGTSKVVAIVGGVNDEGGIVFDDQQPGTHLD